MGHRNLGPLTLVCWLVLSATSGGCTRQEDAFGQLIVSIDTEVPARNMSSADGEFDRLQVQVTQNNAVLVNQDWSFPLESLTFPQTVALVNQTDKPSEPVRVVVTATLDSKPRFVQETQLVVPAEGTAYTFMRLEWLCRGFASTMPNNPKSQCPPGQTCRAGTCAPVAPLADDVSAVPPAAACFDVQACFDAAQDITASLDATCAFTLAAADVAAASTINVALEPVVGQGGLCGSGPAPTCRIALPRSVGSGFTVADGKLQLPPAVCNLLAGGERIARVWLSRNCASRASMQPVCSPWLNR